VALLNNDAEAEPAWLEAMLAAAERHPDAGMVASKIVVFEDPKRIDKAGHLIWPDGQNRGRGTGEVDRGQYDREEEVLWPDGCAALYRRTMLDEIGGFDDDLFAYADDAELGLRARIAGWKCIYTPGAVARHRRGATLGVLSSRRLELIERNRILLAVKHFPASLLWLNLPYFLVRVIAGAIAGLRGRGEAGRFTGPANKLRMALALLRGFVSGVAMIPKTWKKRRALQPIRKLGPREVRQLVMHHRISLRALSEGAN
jgi:GT2 family glycosyltransferase